MDRSAPASLSAEPSVVAEPDVVAEHGVLEAFLSLPLSSIDQDTDEGWDDAVQRLLARSHQRGVGEHGVDEHGVYERGLDEGVAFNSGI